MKKDNVRDYATSAFRFYASQGKPSYDELRQKIYDAALVQAKKELSGIKASGISNPTEQAVINAQREVDNRISELLDVLAVESTLKILSLHKDGEAIKQAIDIVYFTDPSVGLERNDITNRVHAAEFDIPASTAQIYRWLRMARHLFASERGLRI